MVDLKEPEVPGNDNIKRATIGEGWYCSEHESYIKPIFIRIGDATYPACEDCFLNDLKASGAKLGDPIDTGEEELDELVGESDLEQEDDITEEIVAGI